MHASSMVKFLNPSMKVNFRIEWKPNQTKDIYLAAHHAATIQMVALTVRKTIRTYKKNSSNSDFVQFLEGQTRGNKVVLCRLGVDGLCANLDPWTNFSAEWEHGRGLCVTLMMDI